MSEFGDVTAALLAQLTKLVKTMSDGDIKRVASGEAKLVVVQPEQRVVEYTPAVDQVLRALQKLSGDELQIKRVASGESKLAVVQPGQRVVEYTPAVDQTLKALQKLSADELQLLEERQAKVALLRKGDTIISPLDPREVAARVAELRTEDEIVGFLDADTRLTAPKLKLVAAELNIELPPTVKGKPGLQLYIAQRAVQDRGRWAWR